MLVLAVILFMLFLTLLLIPVDADVRFFWAEVVVSKVVGVPISDTAAVASLSSVFNV